MLRAKNLSKSYQGRQVIRDVSLAFDKGQIVGLLGPNGAGKTTCFYMMVGLIKPDQGAIILNGEEITSQPLYQRASQGVGYLPQEASIFRHLSIRDNLKAALELAKRPSHEQETRTEALIEEFGLYHVADTQGDKLSGGERRRAEIARALALDPQFIFLDEPFAGVDPISVADIQSLIACLRDKGIGVLITDHNVRETLAICEKAYILGQGEVIAQGTSEEVLANKEVRRCYLGENFNL